MSKIKISKRLRPVTVPVGERKVMLFTTFILLMLPIVKEPIDISKRFIFDGASIPRVLWSLLGSPFLPQFIGPGLIHDALYRNNSYTRKICDQIMLELMKENGVSMWRRQAIYRGLRIGGWAAWNKHKRNNRENVCCD